MLLRIPDRLPSLVLLVGFWVPAALAGRAAANLVRRRTPRIRPAITVLVLTAFVLASSVAWFFVNLKAVPPYLPGATMDPTFAPPEAVMALIAVTTALVVPGSALACWLAYRSRIKAINRATPERDLFAAPRH
jgi:hypothetical protein